MDYKELLKKYMKHVVAEEGTTYVEFIYGNRIFSKEEIQKLGLLDKEVMQENSKTHLNER